MPKRKFSENELVTRAYTATFRAVEDEAEKGVIYGTPIVFNARTRIHDIAGEFDEIIDKDALRDANLKDVFLFVNHDTNKVPLARCKNGNDNSTMSFTIDSEGLHIRAVLDIDNNAEARALYYAIKRSDLDGMSFMFRIKEQEWKDIDKEIPTRIVRKISIVHEVSAVNYPAYPQTSINARSSEETDYSPLEEAREAYAKEIARSEKALEIEKLKIQNIINLI